MPKIRHFYRLDVFGLFIVGHWDHYPTDEEIISSLDEKFDGNRRLNGDLITFKVEKLGYIED